VVTLWNALATSPGAFLCMPPLCPASSSGEPTVPDMGDQSTPVVSSRMKLRSMTPFDDVSEVKCMVLPFGIALFRRSRRHLCQSPNREHEWEHPHGYCVHGSHLLA
jgi:hypothetical protein